ncbi:MAG: peptidase M61 [Novosphingobium sp.]
MKTPFAALPLLALLLAAPAFAQPLGHSAPVAVPIAQSVPDARDVPYPGTITLDIDASDVTHGAYRVTEVIPVVAGTKDLIVLLPEWLPGNHGPRGDLTGLVDVHFFAGGKELVWRRDPVEVFAFHIDLPAGTAQVTAKFIHTSPLQSAEGRVTMTREMLNLQWEKMSLYPAGYYVRQIRIRPTVTFPEGWTVFTALDGQTASGSPASSNKVSWAETNYEVLVDSPIFAGKYARRWDLGHKASADVVADKPELLALPPQGLAKMRAMVDEEVLAYSSHHWDHYELLIALSDRLGGIGLEHHRSSENSLQPENFIKWDAFDWDRNVIAHELSHSWDGKFRRPAKLWTPDYRQPMQDNLLWVYEGQDQFWGNVHAARSGIQSKEVVLGALASVAGTYAQLPGRSWRSVSDTTLDPIFAARRAKPYASLARGEDYYNEGALIWLEADQLIRKGTKGAKGLDDFAKAFFGIRDGEWGEVTYEFDDVVQALNGVYRYDWAGFLHQRIDEAGRPVPLAGIEMGGYRLVWKDEPNPSEKGRAANAKTLSLYHSIGVTLDKENKVTATRWDGPAFNAGVVNGAKILAVNGDAMSEEVIKKAITAAKGGLAPIQLLIQRGDRFETLGVNYHDGLRWPWLERAVPGKEPNGLDLLLAPHRPIPVVMAKSKAKRK